MYGCMDITPVPGDFCQLIEALWHSEASVNISAIIGLVKQAYWLFNAIYRNQWWWLLTRFSRINFDEISVKVCIFF